MSCGLRGKPDPVRYTDPLAEAARAVQSRSPFLRCSVCRTIVKVIEQHGLGLVCCGRDMLPMRRQPGSARDRRPRSR